MISVMNNDCEFDRKSDGKVEDIELKPRVTCGTIIDSSNDEEKLMNSGVADENGVSPMECSSVTSESETCEEAKLRVRVSSGSDNDVEFEFFQLENQKASANQTDTGGNYHFEVRNDESNGRNDGIEAQNDQAVSNLPRADGHVEVHKSLLSKFDDFVANEKMNVGTSRALSYGLEMGDMVWGKVKSHPWWPGHIFNEAFASSSVRRTRRDGYVLIAFFGDSSYGWFDPAELIPFDPHFMEKSQQPNSRTFAKAVEEAVDEASRRRGLGLACKCRNPFNFRPTKEQGYLTVDVPDFEPGGLYSANQIDKARDGFQSSETLNFVRQLASAPHCCDQMSLDFVKNKATVFAFRKAVFEEFDETYAQAFGVQPACPSHDRIEYQSSRLPPKAPLSGPLVIAEALGSGKNSKKPMKVKDHSKKERFLFKRRDEASDSGAPPISQGQAGSLSPSAVMEGSSTIGAGDFVLQKRTPAPENAVKFEQAGYISREFAGSDGDLSGKEAVTADEASAYSSTVIRSSALDARSFPDIVLDSSGTDTLGKGAFPGLTDGIPSSSQGKEEVMVDIKIEESAKMSRSSEGLQHLEPSFSAREEGGCRLDQVQDSRMGAHPLPIDVKRSVKESPDGKMKKTKIINQPLGDLSTEKPTTGEPKKNKKKKEFGTEPNSYNQQKHLGPKKGEVVVSSLTKNSAQVGLAPREDLLINNYKNDGGASNFALSSVGTSPEVGIGNIEVELPQLLRDLHALALDPFHGVERNCPATIRLCFLRFRCLVYQKSLVLSPPSETEPFEACATKSSSVSGENVRDLSASKPVKHLGRPDNPTKVGRKRLPSDRQEEIAAKRLKKICQLKSLTAEKKSSQRTLDGQRVEGKEHATVPAPKPFRSNPVKKSEPSSKVVEPTMLVMKFPPETSLPSAAELKARFGRFGSIDQSAIRVFWKSSTCRVVFRHKADAEAAYRYANGNNTLFGNVKVRYIIRELEAPVPEVPDFDKVRGDDPSNETSRIKDPMVVDRPIPIPAPGPLSQQMIRLKSCLKKPASDEAGQVICSNGSNSSKGTARVTFMLGGEESDRGGQMMVGNRNNFNTNNNARFADGGASSSSTSVGMNFNSKNFHKVIPPSFSSSPSIPPPHSQSGKPLYNNTHHPSEISPINSHNFNTSAIPPPLPPSIDISQQMLSLLTRCNDVVTHVTSLLGYVPYHPL